MTKATIIGRGDTIDYKWYLMSKKHVKHCKLRRMDIGRRKEQRGEISENKGQENVDNCIVNVPHELYNVIWRCYVHGQRK